MTLAGNIVRGYRLPSCLIEGIVTVPHMWVSCATSWVKLNMNEFYLGWDNGHNTGSDTPIFTVVTPATELIEAS